MIVERNQIFNLMDTNGRRSDRKTCTSLYQQSCENGVYDC